jgi:hypothetical protein
MKLTFELRRFLVPQTYNFYNNNNNNNNNKLNIVIKIIIITQMLQIASFLYFVCVPFTRAHLVIGPRAVKLAWK